MSDRYNLRQDSKEEVQDTLAKAKIRLEQREKFKILAQLLRLDGKAVNVTQSKEIFEAVNREKLDFETILGFHPQQTKDTITETRLDRQFFKKGTYWNPKSPAKAAIKGHIPNCVYYARPKEYWRDKKLVNLFFNTFPKFRISTKRI